jgi:hypothetical protein
MIESIVGVESAPGGGFSVSGCELGEFVGGGLVGRAAVRSRDGAGRSGSVIWASDGVGAELAIHGGDLRHRWTVAFRHARGSWRYDYCI